MNALGILLHTEKQAYRPEYTGALVQRSKLAGQHMDSVVVFFKASAMQASMRLIRYEPVEDVDEQPSELGRSNPELVKRTLSGSLRLLAESL